jgi:hypothetical protein
MATPRTVETSEKLKASAVHIKDSAAHMERSTARLKTAPIDGPNSLLIAPYLPLKGLTPLGFAPVWWLWRVALAQRH